MADADKSEKTRNEDVAEGGTESDAETPKSGDEGLEEAAVVQAEPDDAMPGTGDTGASSEDAPELDASADPDTPIVSDEDMSAEGTLTSDDDSQAIDAADSAAPDEAATAETADTIADDARDDDAQADDARADDAQADDARADDARADETLPDAELPEETAILTPPPPQVTKETVVQRKGGFIPMILGGIVAGGIGYFYAQYETQSWPFGDGLVEANPFEDETRAALAAQTDSVGSVSARVDAVEAAFGGRDLATIEGNVETLSGAAVSLQEQIDGLSSQLALMETRTFELEKRPVSENVAPEAIAAYEREIEAVRVDIEAKRALIQSIADEAIAAEQNAEAQAELSKLRSAMVDVQIGIDRGTPFAAPLGMISASGVIAIPDELSAAAADGVPTLNELQDSFAPAARAALTAERSSAALDAEAGNRVSLFFRQQLGVRSVIPRDGEGADATLSRADAATRSGDLVTAITKIDALSPVAQSAMQDWVAKARTRLAVQSAAESLAQELNKE